LKISITQKLRGVALNRERKKRHHWRGEGGEKGLQRLEKPGKRGRMGKHELGKGQGGRVEVSLGRMGCRSQNTLHYGS